MAHLRCKTSTLASATRTNTSAHPTNLQKILNDSTMPISSMLRCDGIRPIFWNTGKVTDTPGQRLSCVRRTSFLPPPTKDFFRTQHLGFFGQMHCLPMIQLVSRPNCVISQAGPQLNIYEAKLNETNGKYIKGRPWRIYSSTRLLICSAWGGFTIRKIRWQLVDLIASSLKTVKFETPNPGIRSPRFTERSTGQPFNKSKSSFDAWDPRGLDVLTPATHGDVLQGRPLELFWKNTKYVWQKQVNALLTLYFSQVLQFWQMQLFKQFIVMIYNTKNLQRKLEHVCNENIVMEKTFEESIWCDLIFPYLSTYFPLRPKHIISNRWFSESLTYTNPAFTASTPLLFLHVTWPSLTKLL